MNKELKKVILSDKKDKKNVQRLLALNGIKKSDPSKAMTRSEMMRLFRITPDEDKMKIYFDLM